MMAARKFKALAVVVALVYGKRLSSSFRDWLYINPGLSCLGNHVARKSHHRCPPGAIMSELYVDNISGQLVVK